MKKVCLSEQLKLEFENYKEFWDYYGNDEINPFESVEKSKKFTIRYFGNGSKNRAIYYDQSVKSEKDLFRNTHTIGVFFIGVMLQRIIDKNISIVSECNEGAYPFSYYWFLTCLSHDWGYVFENGKGEDEVEDIIRKNEMFFKNRYQGVSLSQSQKRKLVPVYHRLNLYKEANIDIKMTTPSLPRCYDYKLGRRMCRHRQECECEYEYGCHCICKYSVHRGYIKYNNGTIIRQPWYDNMTKENYFAFRLFNMRKFDHGIVGADKLFSELIENYKSEFLNNKDRGRFCGFFNRKNLYFSCEEFKIFAYIANSIAAHNVFMADENEEIRKHYIEYGLECLLPENFRKISYATDPLLFILCVADTIEPTKRFRNWKTKRVFQNIGINFDKDTNVLTVYMYGDILKHNNAQKYKDDIKNLEKWCEIKVVILEYQGATQCEQT